MCTLEVCTDPTVGAEIRKTRTESDLVSVTESVAAPAGAASVGARVRASAPQSLLTPGLLIVSSRSR